MTEGQRGWWGAWLSRFGRAVTRLFGGQSVKTSRAESGSQRMRHAQALQEKGLLDQAFAEFRQVPMGEALMDSLYRLALDFERKREFVQADTVLRYIAGHNPEFRDIAQRLKRGQRTALSVETGVAQPRSIGPYQLGRVLGKGAMGLVYESLDTRNKRVVAIKTMALKQAFDADEMVELKGRFLREAESAGRLAHPNIVAVFDSGDDNETAYIAMEFLRGRDLTFFCKPGQLLPLDRVLSIVVRVADALDFAHRQNVVHRDVKPANVMYDADTDQVKVTDFGVARLTDASRTKTGMVLGSPSYMSPEQLSGKKVDGRSDIFSLGVTLYQMVCGKLPFMGESIAQLMLKITREAHPDIRSVNPLVPDSVVTIIDRALTKDVAKRYQTGADMAAELRVCRQALAVQHSDVDVQ